MPDRLPLTDLQQAYWVGRRHDVELGGVAIHFYYEVDCGDLDLPRLEEAWNRVVRRHPMLRAVVTEDGRQEILDTERSYSIGIEDLTHLAAEVRTQRQEALRSALSHRNESGHIWPNFDLRVTRLSPDRHRVHLSFDGLVTDYRSHFQVLEEWGLLYLDPEQELPPVPIHFRDFLGDSLEAKTEGKKGSDWAYWKELIGDLPPSPKLPLARDREEVGTPRFARETFRMEAQRWSTLKDVAAGRGLSASRMILAAYTETLRRFCEAPDFTLNVSILDAIGRQSRFQDVVGAFGSTTLLPVWKADGASFATRAAALQSRLTASLRHSVVSGIEVLREWNRLREESLGTQMPIVYTGLFGLGARFGQGLPVGWLGECVYSITQTPQVTLDLQAREVHGSLILDFDFRKDVFSRQTVADLAGVQGRLLELLSEREETWTESVPRLAWSFLPAAQKEVMNRVNEVSAPKATGLLQNGFLEQARVRPEALAVIAGDRRFTYGQLHDLSRRLSSWLSRTANGHERPVSIVMEKGWEQVVAVLGTLLAGFPYLPVDADLPAERIRHLLERTDARCLLTHPGVEEKVVEVGARHVLAVTETDLSSMPIDAPSTPTDPGSLAYVIFTSGSSGVPKGVMVEHRQALNTIEDINDRYSVNPADRVLAISSLSFDLSVYDIFGLLSTGGTIVLPDSARIRDPSACLDLLHRHEITLWNSVPALMQMVVEYAELRSKSLPDSLRCVMLSGDWIPVSLPGRIRQLGQGPRVDGLGGATEASVWSIAWDCETVDPDWMSVPYGKPLRNQPWYVLDDELAPRPLGIPGELCIGGEGVARGYWDDEDLTKRSFVNHPLTGDRMFRTGDVGRLLPDGYFEILGRRDFQVKVNGYRVELSEVEAILGQHSGVASAVVIAEGPQRGEKRLVAFVVPDPSFDWSPDDLRGFLASKLPGYMVPTQFVRLERLPLTPTGKVDRSGLQPVIPTGSLTEIPPSVQEAQSEDTRRLLQDIVESVLGRLPEDPGENLVSFGATSIDVTRILNRIENALGIRPSLRDFFENPTIDSLVSLCTSMLAPPSSDDAPAVARDTILLRDPDEREAFKRRQVALYDFDEGHPRTPLFPVGTIGELEARFSSRRSHRRFGSSLVPVESVSGLLENLRILNLGGEPKRYYGSAGGLYPVQTYCFFKEDRMEGGLGGAYYYDPREHALVHLSGGRGVRPELYDPFVNQPIFESSAFALFLVADMDAIEPAYGRESPRYVAVEAGLICQALEVSAPDFGLGLCQVGDLEFDQVAKDFLLGDRHRFVHSLLGGLLPPEDRSTG